jgi:Raf kinase inhibitor-like YbhB/YbcL family protein
MKLTSSAFEKGASIPAKYSCDGDRFLSPPLTISGVPKKAQSLVLIMDDPDVPKEFIPSGIFVHWVSFNIPPETKEIPEGMKIGVLGVNGRGEIQYTGPCPPPDREPKAHRYVFKLFALDTPLTLSEGATKEDVETAMGGHVLAHAELIGMYSRA